MSEGETGTETGCSCCSLLADSSCFCASSSTGIRVSSSTALIIVGIRDLGSLCVKRWKEVETFRNERVGEEMGIAREWE